MPFFPPPPIPLTPTSTNTLPLLSCTETLTDTMFGIYTSFVMHTHNMCFYLQSSQWQKKLDRTVDRLQDNSDVVANRLEVGCLLSRTLNCLQLELDLIILPLILKYFLIISKTCLFQIQAHKQENLLLGMDAMTDMNTDILSKTEKLQSFIAHVINLVEKIGYIQQAFFNQFSTYEMLLFYFGSIIVTLMTTSFPGVYSARPAMLCMTAISLAIEQAIAQNYGLIFDVSLVYDWLR